MVAVNNRVLMSHKVVGFKYLDIFLKENYFLIIQWKDLVGFAFVFQTSQNWFVHNT